MRHFYLFFLYIFCISTIVKHAITYIMSWVFGYLMLLHQMAPTQSMTSFFQPVKMKQSKRLNLWNVMRNDAKLTWGRSYLG